MLKKILAGSGSSSLHTRWRTITNRCSSTTTSVSSAVNSMLLRSLKEHYLEISKIEPPPKINPPNSFSVVKGAFESTGPVFKRDYGNEEIVVSVMKLPNIIPGGGGGGDYEEDDAIGIHSVSLAPKTQASQLLAAPDKYAGPTFQDLDQKMRNTLHGYIEERGINESLFCFLQSWLYVKDHRNGLKWFKAVGSFITKPKSAQDVPQ
ncbi:mitochondrial acidic protein MAM33-like isoform X2 [Papaver somniferum]|uniref:mitochondrial acidic protein MAM33-like isoform X2 n=1 Tax=Papaver somniferum TaxID=3469 RepID=UPI000E6F6A69|nr:mitochondrial acidic protein MAM33-like isoform X2 [Papaver somniferum]